MNNTFASITFLLVLLLLSACLDKNPNLNKKGKDELKSFEIAPKVNIDSMPYQDIIYVPIYSDIYASSEVQKNLLAATLSIRNTSFDDSLFVSKVDYFNTHGDLVKGYLDQLIALPPMATVNYVIKKEDDTGGAGANFIIKLSARNKDIKPLIQAIMVDYTGNKAFSFSTDGYSLKN